MRYFVTIEDENDKKIEVEVTVTVNWTQKVRQYFQVKIVQEARRACCL